MIVLLFNDILAQSPYKIVILHTDLDSETPFAIRCNDVSFSYNSTFKEIIIDRAKDLVKFQKILKKIRFTSTNHEPDVRIKIEAYYKKQKITICMGDGNNLINGRPAEYSEELMLFFDSMKTKYKSRTGGE